MIRLSALKTSLTRGVLLIAAAGCAGATRAGGGRRFGARDYDYTDARASVAFKVSPRPIAQFTRDPQLPNEAGGLGAATAMRRLWDGRFVIATAGIERPGPSSPADGPRGRGVVLTPSPRFAQLRIFDSTGTVLSTFGRTGTLGELLGPARSIRELPSGELFVVGPSPGWTIYGPTGRFVSAHTAGSSLTAGMLDEGTVITYGVQVIERPTYDPKRGSFAVALADLTFTGIQLNTMALHPLTLHESSPRVVATPDPKAKGVALGNSPSPWPVLASPPVIAVDDGIWVFDVVAWAVNRHAANGALQWTARLPMPEANRTAVVGQPYLKDTAATRQIIVDDIGRFWIATEPTPSVLRENSPKITRSWWVLAPDGKLLGTVVTPAGFIPMDIGRSFVLGLEDPHAQRPLVTMYALTPVGLILPGHEER